MVGLGGDPANHITTPPAINDDIKGSIRHGGVGWEKIISRNIRIISGNLRVGESFFQNHPDLLVWMKPQAGSVAFPLWIGKPAIEEVCEQLVEKMGVMLVPGSLFDYPGSHFRIGLGRANFAAALEQFGTFLDSYS